MKCPTCGQDNSHNAQFCGVCGTPLVISQANSIGGTSFELTRVSFPDAVKRGFSNYFSFNGRSTRAEYWWWVLFTFVGSGILGIADNIINVFAEAGQASLLSNLFVLATLIPSLALGSRRLHDIGKSGWWQLAIISLMALGFILIIVGIVVAFISGSDGDLGLVVWLILVGSGLCALVVTFVWGIRWFVRQGEDGPSEYGPDPRQPNSQQAYTH